jgi:hypothetical protein
MLFPFHYRDVRMMPLSPNLTARLRDLGVFTSSPHGQPNHIILNEVEISTYLASPLADSRFSQYLAGQGIMVN